MTKRYTKAISGPDLSEPFRVTKGLVVISLQRQGSIVIPTGGGWPGLAHLTEAMRVHLQPTGTFCLNGTVTEPDDESGRPAALALITAQALTSAGLIADRLQFADEAGVQLRQNNQATAALVLSATREAYTRVLNS